VIALSSFACTGAASESACSPNAEDHVVDVDGVAAVVLRDPTWEGPEVPVVMVLGGWEVDWIPLTDNADRLVDGFGLVEVFLDLPGGPDNPIGWPHTEGDDDQHGQQARAAVAKVLRYAGGEVEDRAGCLITDRVPELVPELLTVVGSSNGGNLALPALADPDLDVPTVSGLVTWEAPAGPQFVLKEIDGQDELSCGWSEAWESLTCDVSYAGLTHDGVTWQDIDLDGEVDDGEPVFDNFEVDGRWLHSPPMSEALGEVDDALSLEESLAWFEWRDAGGAAAAAVARQPDMAAIVIGFETDHALDAEGSPHVVGLAGLLAEAGAWTRLNPDSVYTDASVENAAGQGLDLDDPGAMLPNVTGRRAALAAGVAELAARRQTGDWSPDLDQRL